ncbi:MAG TPA: TraB/GumN family protein, partial [Pseudomonadaceae bacterium]|nr:TraB/GumN family protein [Pseudomonadaceae bacterium]
METVHRYAAFCLLWLLMLLPVQAMAQGIGGPQCTDPGAGFLWEVQSPALQAEGGSLHLFGSIHIGKPGFYPLPPRLESLLQNADYLVFEVNPQVAEDPQVALQMALRGMLPGGQTLDQVLSADALQNLEVVLQELGLPLANFMNYKPWMLAVILTGLQAAKLGFDPAWGVESYLLRQKAPDTGILELESWQEQLDMLEALDPELFLDYSLEELSAG